MSPQNLRELPVVPEAITAARKNRNGHAQAQNTLQFSKNANRSREFAEVQAQEVRHSHNVFVSGSSIAAGTKIETFDQVSRRNLHESSSRVLATQCSPSERVARLGILENFKKINAMVRSNFMSKDLNARRAMDKDQLSTALAEDTAAEDVIVSMKKL